jgi:hypothetical protein
VRQLKARTHTLKPKAHRRARVAFEGRSDSRRDFACRAAVAYQHRAFFLIDDTCVKYVCVQGLPAVTWDTDPTCSAQLASSGTHYFGMILDVGPGMVLFFVDGKLCDGGVTQRTDKHWSAGWRLLPVGLGDIKGAEVSDRAILSLRHRS